MSGRDRGRAPPPAPTASSPVTLRDATSGDADAIAGLRREVAEALTSRYGRGHWSSAGTAKGVLFGMRHGRFVSAVEDGEVVGVLRLSRRKPWAIDPASFTPASAPLHLTDMAVAPRWQGRGLGRRLLEEARRAALAWPADALRLDAYDAEAGGGGFYAACGFREVGRVTYRSTPLIYYEMVLQPPGGP